MKIRQAIKQLEAIAAEHGEDLDVVSVTETDELFAIVHEVVFDVIELPDESEKAFTRVCALMEPIDESAGRPNLKIVNKEA